MARAKKSRVKSTARSERMKKQWADPEYRKKMGDRARDQRAREKASPPPQTPPTDPPSPSPTDPPAAPPSRDPKASAAKRRGWTSGRAW